MYSKDWISRANFLGSSRPADGSIYTSLNLMVRCNFFNQMNFSIAFF